MRHIDISVFAIEILFFNQIFCVVYTSKPYYMETFSFRITSYFLIKISKAFSLFTFLYIQLQILFFNQSSTYTGH